VFSRWLDVAAQRQFVKDASGRTLFFPRGLPHRCYYVEAADESRLKSLLKMYAIAAALINLTGSMASLGLTEALAFDHGHALPEKIKFALAVYLICSLLFFIGPLLILWRVYRDALVDWCAPLTVAHLASLRPVPTNSNSVRIWFVLLGAALILLGLIVFLLAARHPV
jgi:hypothetical protein